MRMTRIANSIRRFASLRFLIVGALAVGIFVPAVVFAGGPANGTVSSPPPQRYVALGDSVAAGAGLATANNNNDGLCGRSSRSYPYAVAEALKTNVEHYACTGAKIDEGIYDSQVRKDTQLFPQLDRAFFTGTPDLITLTAGANDARWAETIQACYITECGSTVDDYAMKVLRTDIRLELAYALHQIRSRSEGATPRVMVSGYYAPFSQEVNCVSGERFTAGEVAWLHTQHVELNRAIQETAAKFTFAEYVPIDFSGHELCSDDPWVQSLASFSPLHPTVEGQQAIGRAFIAQL